MSNKGVSAIIATILLLMITIALAGTAYVYMSGMIGGRTSKTISLLDASCTSNKLNIVLSNDGTSQITISSDLKFFVNNIESTFATSPSATTISPHVTQVFINSTALDTYPSGTYTVLVVSPSNAIRQVIYC